jgi:hypothetical protein
VRRSIYFFLAAFFIYNLNLRPIPSGDTSPAALLPFAIWSDHTIAFDRFASWYVESQQMNPAWFVRVDDGHYYSRYPISMPLALTPFYAPLAAVFDLHHMPVERTVLLARVCEKVSASLIAALSVVAFLALAERLTAARTALLLTIVYAFGSETWSISSQALWQQGGSELLIILSLLCLAWAADQLARLLPVVLAGSCAGFGMAHRLTNVIFFVLLGGYVLLSRWSVPRKVAFAVSAIVMPAAVLAYNLLLFGRPLGGFISIERFQGNNMAGGLAGLLISPSRGLLVFSPVFVFAAIGVYLWFRGHRTPHPEIYWICMLTAAAHIVMVSRWRGWGGGANYGPRLLTDVIPCLVILFIPAMHLVERSRGWKLAFATMLVLSITVQGIGAFCYPNGHWDTLPVPVNKQRERLWEWKDNQIFRSATAGPVLEPYRLAYRFLARPGGPPEESLKNQGVKLW